MASYRRVRDVAYDDYDDDYQEDEETGGGESPIH
jgi:hypothetical protein